MDKKSLLNKKQRNRSVENLFRERRKLPNTPSITVLLADGWDATIHHSKTLPEGNWTVGWNFYGSTIDEAYARAYERLYQWTFLPIELSIFGILHKGNRDLDLSNTDAGLGGLSIYKMLFKSQVESFYHADKQKREWLQEGITNLVRRGVIIRSPFTGCFFTVTKYRNVMKQQGFGMLVRGFSYDEEVGRYVYR